MNFNIKYKQVGIQDDSHAIAQLPDITAGTPINSRPNSLMAFADRQCVIPKTFSQRMYQSQAVEIAKELAQVIDANSLEEIKKLLEKYLPNQLQISS